MNIEQVSVKGVSNYDSHHKVFQLLQEGATIGFLAIHRKHNTFPSFGATRINKYNNTREALEDALELSRTMSYKSAVFNLPYGGAKAVLDMSPESATYDLLAEYAQVINDLGGQLITGTDAGFSQRKLEFISTKSEYVVGTKYNPTKHTVDGIWRCLEATISKELNADIKSTSFAIQGLGKTGSSLLSNLIDNGVRKIHVSDLNEGRVEQVKNKYPFVEVLKVNNIFSVSADVFCPCALSNVFDVSVCDRLQCEVIPGSANNQLENSQVGKKLHNQEILYAPDYVVNAGGLLAVIREYGQSRRSFNPRIPPQEIPLRISDNLNKIFEKSKETSTAPNFVANNIAIKNMETWE